MSIYDEYKKRHRKRKGRQTDVTDTFYSYGHRVPDPYDRYLPQNTNNNRRPAGRFMLQAIFAAILFVSVYWIDRSDDPFFQPVKSSVKSAMTHEFQFVAVSDWYQKNFGDPIGFLPGFSNGEKQISGEGQDTGSSNHPDFAAPVSGEITDPYSSKTKGVTVATSLHSDVVSVKDGLVVFAGEKKGTGKTVVIQHKDNDESWYGKLDKVDVKVYDEVKRGQKIGTTSGDKKGSFYFALKKGEKFIDPIQVMSFD